MRVPFSRANRAPDTLRGGTRTLAVAIATAFCLALIAGASVGNAGPNGKGKKAFSKQERAIVSAAKTKGEKVTLLFAATPGEAAQLSAALKGLGAEIGYEHDGISYVRATLAAEKVDAAAALENVEAVDVDTIIPLDDPRPDGTQPVAPQVPPTAATPRSNGYMPTRDTGAAQWVEANPTLDGRGIKVGILDSGIDLGHPSLNTTSTGERKIVDWVTYTHPSTDADPTWVLMNTQVNGPTFTAAGGTYTAPGTGPYQFGRFNERDPRLGGEVGSDVNRDGNPAGSNGFFPVLWDKATNQVWVDTNQNNSFADQTAMTDYKTNFDVGTFGTDNPATPVREAMPFVVQTASSAPTVTDRVNIGIVSAAHGSHVAGIVAGNKLFGGSMSGAAPGAKLVSVRVCLFIAGCTAHALVEGMIYAIEKADVDVVNMSIGGLPALNDGNNARAILYDRLIEDNGVQMFISAGNSGAGLNTIGDPSVASKVMSIGSSITAETWRLNYGSDSAFADNLHPFSSRGPSESGAFKPQITAPGSAVSTVPTWQPGQPLAGTFALPPGYGMFNGTSMASPQSAGAAALLLGAAKASGLTVTPAQLRQAFNSTARYFPRYKASDQGNGLLVLNAAWQMVKAGITPVTITSAVPVNTLLSGFLATPGIGEGIYDREGVVAGSEVRPRHHLHADERALQVDRLQAELGRQRRHVPVGGCATAQAERAELAEGEGTAVDVRPPLGDPERRRSEHAGCRLPDDEHGRRGRHVHGRERVHRPEEWLDRPEPDGELLLRSSGWGTRVQGRHHRRRSRTGRRSDPLPALPSVRRRHRDQRDDQLLQPARGCRL